MGSDVESQLPSRMGTFVCLFFRSFPGPCPKFTPDSQEDGWCKQQTSKIVVYHKRNDLFEKKTENLQNIAKANAAKQKSVQTKKQLIEPNDVEVYSVSLSESSNSSDSDYDPKLDDRTSKVSFQV